MRPRPLEASAARAAIAITAVAALAVATARDARAAGIALDVQSARGTGMAAATTAMIDDSSAIYYNPAGIAQGKILDAQVGDTLILPSFKFAPSGAGATANSLEVIPPFNAYVSAGVSEAFSLGIGVFTPYGSTIEWPAGWVGQRLTTSSQFATYDINPTVAYRFGPLRIGAGIQFVRATVDLKQQVATGAAELGSSEIGAGGWGGGANIGVQADLLKQYLTLGVHYRSAVKINFDGNAHFDNIPVELQSILHDQSVTAALTTPGSVAVGLATRAIDRLVIDADVVWYGWSTLQAINVNFPNDASGTLSRSEPKNWIDRVNYHLGGELALSDQWRVRAGVLYDPTPSPDDTLAPDVPDANRLNIALGVGYTHPLGLHVDLGYQFIALFSHTSTLPELPGTYSAFVNVVGLSIGWRMPLCCHHADQPEPLASAR